MTKATNTFLAAWLVLSLAVPSVDAQTELGGGDEEALLFEVCFVQWLSQSG